MPLDIHPSMPWGMRFTRASVAIESADGYHFSVDAGGHVDVGAANWTSAQVCRLPSLLVITSTSRPYHEKGFFF
jgi:hypothetical protein